MEAIMLQDVNNPTEYKFQTFKRKKINELSC